MITWVANKLYKEHYTTIPTKNAISIYSTHKTIEYQWQINNEWNSIYVEACAHKDEMQTNSLEEFIFEHYYGYTKIDTIQTEEYKISHPRWKVNKIKCFNINYDFDGIYGKNFSFLKTVNSYSVFIAEGSAISVNWKRKRIK